MIPPLEFFRHLVWLDGAPLLTKIEPYRQRIFTDTLYTFNADNTPRINLVLSGRAKKNWKTADLILAALYRFLAWPSPQGNDCFLLANDEGQAADDLKLAKKIIAANPLLEREVNIKQREIERLDGKGSLMILPAKDVTGAHGKTYLFIGFDEIHGYRSWDIFEALAPDPTRLDALTWITSYASIYNTPGAPLFDLIQQGKKGEDPRLYFSWYSADFTTDPDLQGEDISSERRANPSSPSWDNPGYLEQQRRRLPTHKFRRLHLNLPGMPEGTYLDAERVVACIAAGRRVLRYAATFNTGAGSTISSVYRAFVDMSGGSSDDAVLAIAHCDPTTGRAVLDNITTQTGRPPFNPRHAVEKFAAVLKEYGLSQVTGDRYAGETFRQDFGERGIGYAISELTRHQLYEALEPRINAEEVELLDLPKLQEQLLGLVVRGTKIDHIPGEHDDWANAAAGALWLAQAEAPASLNGVVLEDADPEGWRQRINEQSPAPWRRGW